MKRLLGFIFSFVTIVTINGQPEKKITILHTNDLHSHVVGFGPELNYTPMTLNDDKTIGGFARIATIIRGEKEKNEGGTLVIDAGDFLMGTLFQSLEQETGFQLRLMSSIGYDVTCLGNHEFDFGPEWLASVINAAHSNGKIPTILIGNSQFDKKDNRDDGLEKLFSDNVISRKLVVIKEGIKFGLFSIIGKNAVDDSPRAVPVKFEKQASFAKKMVKELRAEKCDIVICVSHSGIEKEKNGEWGGEDVELAKKVRGIDLIVGGHTHTLLPQPVIVNGIPIVQAGEYGEFVGRLTLTYSGRKLKIEDYKLIPVDDKILGDKNTNQIIEEQKARINDEVLKPLGLTYDKPLAETRFVLEGNESGNFLAGNLGPLVVDAIQYYVNKHANKGTDVSMVAAGVLRDKILAGKQTAPDIFRVMSLGSGNDNVPGYALSRMYVTGRELKSILEILQVAYKSSPDYYCYYSGIRVEYNPDKGLLKKIKKIDLVHPDGSITNVDFSRKNKAIYSVTANSYMVEFMGIIRKMSFGLIKVIPKDAGGKKIENMKTAVIDMDENRPGVQEGKEWLALLEYLSSMQDSDGDKIPDIDEKYNVPVKAFIEVKSYK
jgi:5'-nucleotidase / UDP-sugar diphosphatase